MTRQYWVVDLTASRSVIDEAAWNTHGDKIADIGLNAGEERVPPLSKDGAFGYPCLF
jgi:hypothetical protein